MSRHMEDRQALGAGRHASGSAEESFTEYLRRVGADYEESGSEHTAQDYRDAADRIEALQAEVAQLKLKMYAVNQLSAE